MEAQHPCDLEDVDMNNTSLHDETGVLEQEGDHPELVLDGMMVDENSHPLSKPEPTARNLQMLPDSSDQKSMGIEKPAEANTLGEQAPLDEALRQQTQPKEHSKPDEVSHRASELKESRAQAQSMVGCGSEDNGSVVEQHEKAGQYEDSLRNQKADLPREHECQTERNLLNELQSSQREIAELRTLSQRYQSEVWYWQTEVQRCEQHYIKKLRQQNSSVQRLEQQSKALTQQIEKVEILNAQQTVAETGSYDDLTATPPLLQTAVDYVKEAVTICASDLFSHMKKYSSEFTFSLEDFGSELTPNLLKIALQAELCTCLFNGFENQTFGIATALELFERPKDQKQRFFKRYRHLRYLEVTEMLQQPDFLQFWLTKQESLVKVGDAMQIEDFLQKTLSDESSRVYKSFLRLARATWVLHKLAFAFEPTAEVFRVAGNSIFDEEYMKNINEDEDEDGGGDASTAASLAEAKSLKTVAFMVVPGFTVRNTIVKAFVCLNPLPPPPPPPQCLPQPTNLLSKAVSKMRCFFRRNPN